MRREKPETWYAIAQQNGTMIKKREGKIVYLGSQKVEFKEKTENDEVNHQIRLIYKVTEETILPDGQTLLMPKIEVDTYWTSLPDEPKVIIELYEKHGTSEQFHSEIKTDLDLERLPSGKFATNNLVLHPGVLAYNILRIIGQMMVCSTKTPLRKKAQRRRIRTVIHNLIYYLACRLVYHARQYKLSFGHHSPWFLVFKEIYQKLSYV
ncbi:hypothetical protein BBF96_02375 [Anoxybacter fermentans]|uniref:Transposase DDE domain-containing protein n=1 Tax=Anoxybacter fermentans TaxID=1323375 RepID=A0A3Q9HQG6_9FIRM|nr:hypothetical protein BBF96_02375 [Anoxybacter fermentans]